MEGSEKAAEAKAICVVIDTNIWRSEWLLRTARGAALLFNLRQSNGVLGMPEVIEREIVKHTVAAGVDCIKKIESHFQMLRVLVGSTAYEVPTVEQLQTHAKSRLDELKSLFVPVPFTLEHAKSALDRVNSGLPPNGPKNQQYKDSAIWEAIIDLARSYRVYFLTNDKAFFRDPEKPIKGLADNLAAECREIGGDIHIYRDISSCLEDLQKHAAPLDRNELAIAIEAKIVFSSLEKAAASRDYSLTGERISVSISPFATEQIDKLALTFELAYRLADVSENETAPRLEPTLTVKGNCFYNPITKEVSNVLMNAEVFTWRDITGQEFTNTNHYVYASGSIVLGGLTTVAHTIKEPVE
jgi:PIN domain